MLRALKKYKYPYLFICPYILLFLFFQLIPTIWTVSISFQDWNGLAPARSIGLANYQMMFEDYMFLDSIRNTLIYWISSALGVIILSVAIASLLESSTLRAKRFFKTATFLPYVCASVAMGLIFGMLFEENSGLINELIASAGGQRIPWLTSGRYSRIPVIILHIWRLTPWYTMIVLSGLLNISDEYYEAARVDGANSFHQFIMITLPLLKHILFFCFVTVTVDSWKLFNESYVLSGPGTSNISLFQLMYQTAFSIFKMGYASAIGCILILILLFISVVQFLLRKKQGEF